MCVKCVSLESPNTFSKYPLHVPPSLSYLITYPLLSRAQVTIPLMDIALECLCTSSGYHHQRYVLVASQTLKPSVR